MIGGVVLGIFFSTLGLVTCLAGIKLDLRS